MENTAPSSDRHDQVSNEQSQDPTLTLLREILAYINQVEYCVDGVDDQCFDSYIHSIAVKANPSNSPTPKELTWYGEEGDNDTVRDDECGFLLLHPSDAKTYFQPTMKFLLVEMIREYGRKTLMEVGFERQLEDLDWAVRHNETLHEQSMVAVMQFLIRPRAE